MVTRVLVCVAHNWKVAPWPWRGHDGPTVSIWTLSIQMQSRCIVRLVCRLCAMSHPLCLCWAPLARARRLGRDPRYLYHFYTIRGLLLNRTFYFVLFTRDRVKCNVLSWERWNQACRCCHQPPQQQRNINCWQWSVYFLVSAANNTLIIANIDIWCRTEESFVLTQHSWCFIVHHFLCDTETRDELGDLALR